MVAPSLPKMPFNLLICFSYTPGLFLSHSSIRLITINLLLLDSLSTLAVRSARPVGSMVRSEGGIARGWRGGSAGVL